MSVSAPGLAVLCTYDGMVEEVLHDDLASKAEPTTSAHLAALFDEGSVQKALSLVLRVKEQGAVFGWELDLATTSGPRALSFDAALVGDRILVLTSEARAGETGLLDGMTQVVNDQVNSLRALNKRLAHRDGDTAAAAEAPDHAAQDMVRNMLEMNNRLVNAERALARKNSELKRLSAVLSKDLHLAQKVLDCSGEAVVVVGGDRRIVEVNPAFTAITGFTRAEVVGTTMVLCEPAQHPAGFADGIWQQAGRTGHWQGECTGRRKDGGLYPRWQTVSVVPDDQGAMRCYAVIFSDIKRLKTAEERWHQLAFYDSLTLLPNRVLFKDRLQQAMLRARREQTPLALLFIDLDEFKIVNDSLGHDAGDQLLAMAARRIEGCVREADSIARLGGDEFTVVLHGRPGELDVVQVCEKILRALQAPFDLLGHQVQIGASIGVARFPADGEEPDTLIKNADAAMYAAKSAGRNTSRYFSQSLGDRISRHLQTRSQIAQGLQNGEFSLELQPAVHLDDGRVHCLEALLRWDHPERGRIAPDVFIPVAEESGLIVDLGEFAIRRAIAIVRELRAGPWPQARVAVNVSRRQLAAPGLARFIAAELLRAGLPGPALMVEVTESMVMSNPDHAAELLHELHDNGVGAAMDDFGTGYSSLSALRRLPVELLKIDRSFVADADVSRESASIIGAIVAMAHGLGLKTVAEGVEREAQASLLRQIGCDIGQGHWFAPPQPPARLHGLIDRDGRLRPPGLSSAP